MPQEEQVLLEAQELLVVLELLEAQEVQEELVVLVAQGKQVSFHSPLKNKPNIL